MSAKHMNHYFCLESHHRNVLLQGYPILLYIYFLISIEGFNGLMQHLCFCFDISTGLFYCPYPDCFISRARLSRNIQMNVVTR